MPRFGAWVHGHDGSSLAEQLRSAHACGIQSARSYTLGYAEAVAPALRELGMSLYAGMHVEAEGLLRDWRSQARTEELEEYHRLGVPLEAVCVGNELRQHGDDPDRKAFTARLAFCLAKLIRAYRRWLDEHGYKTPLTYAMEGIVLDDDGVFHDHVRPLIDACDVVSINLYPMNRSAWHGPAQFEESKAFLCDARVRNNRLLRFARQLRGVLQAAAEAGRPVILSETGFPSALGYEQGEQGLIAPVSDNERYGEAMEELLGVIDRADADYGRPIRAIYFYEWRDNLHHAKITNIEHSPIHCAFGLCDRFGAPKFDLKALLERYQGNLQAGRSMKTKKGVEVPADLAGALQAQPEVLAIFEDMRPSCQQRYVRWVLEAKGPDTRERRIAKTSQAILKYGRGHGKA